jgi:glycine hydroxymethyltransferase
VLTGGTDNHLLLINVHTNKLTGRQAESALHECLITLNRNSLPRDPNGPWYTSGIRLGTAAVTSLGMGIQEMKELGAIIADVIKGTVQAPDKKDPAKKSKANFIIEDSVKAEAQRRVKALMDRFPVYPQLDLQFLKNAFVL